LDLGGTLENIRILWIRCSTPSFLVIIHIIPHSASSSSSGPTSGWQLPPSKMSMPPWSQSSLIRSVTLWLPTLATTVRKTSRTSLCSSTIC
uniref:Uncharacterized protein n=1 Tax=Vombatus ursinus TaxID=29139 RepID=A0A4X2KDM6_VOMUR